MTKRNGEIPEALLLAQSLQKGRAYSESRKLYLDFFNEHPTHYLRFKALFEVADNWFHEQHYKNARQCFLSFIAYCDEQDHLTEEEQGWIRSYCQLARSRINQIENMK